MAGAVTRRAMFARAAARLVPDAEGIAAVGVAMRNYSEAEGSFERSGNGAALERARKAWEGGDSTALRRIEPASAALVERAGVAPRATVLDVAAGDGNLALAAAARGARVTAIELSAEMISRGKARCDAVGTQVDWVLGDLEAMPFTNGAFDSVLSSFGAIYASRARVAARELVRVARPGGCVAIAAWSSTGFMGRVLELAASLVPRKRGASRPSRWGRYESAYLWLGSALDGFEVTERSIGLEFESATEGARALAAEPGPLRAALTASSVDQRREAGEALLGLIARHRDPSSTGAVRIDASYLVINGRRRAI
jgi:SAM-dependent methyltransferase